MASVLISKLYETINKEGTDIVGADSSSYPYCVLAFEIAIENWGTTEYIDLYIQRPQSLSLGWDVQAFLGLFDNDGHYQIVGGVEFNDVFREETAPNEFSIFYHFVVDEGYRDIFENPEGTLVCALCSDVKSVQDQLGKVTTSPESVLLTTSLNDPYAPTPGQLPTPSLSISCDDAVLATITETESATTFHLEYRVYGTSTWNEYTGHIVSADSNVEVVDITDLLTGGTVYEFRAYCSDSSGKYEDSDYSEVVSFKLFSKVAYKGVKSRTTSAISFYTTNLGLSGSDTTWIAEYRKRGTETWLTANTSNGSQLTVSASSLIVDSVYDFRIRLTRSEGESTWFYVAQTTKGNQTATPPTCTVGSTTIAATWTPPTGYNWYQLSAVLNGTVVARNAWTQATSDTLTGLAPGTTYTMRVQYRITAEGDAYENDGYRGTVDVTTLLLLATPTGLSATNITSTSARLSWGAVTNAVGYKVEYRAVGASAWLEATE